jgi:hypothetical protein
MPEVGVKGQGKGNSAEAAAAKVSEELRTKAAMKPLDLAISITSASKGNVE